MNGIGSLFQSTSSKRLSGLSGFDTESTITSLMDAEKVPLTQLQQKRQVAVWRQEAYRDITSTLRGIKSSYFDVLSKSSYMLSDESMRSLSVSSTASSYVTATATSDAELGSHTIKIEQLATAQTASSQAGVTKALVGSGAPASMALSGQSITMTLDGVTKKVQLADYADFADMQSKLQTAVDSTFGTGKITVSSESGALKITTGNTVGKLTLSSTSATDAGLSGLGFTSGASNRINVNSSLESLSTQLGGALTFNGGNVELTVNGKAFSFSKGTSLSSVMSTINQDSTANVRMTYDEGTDKITIKAKQLGAGTNVQLSESGSTLLSALQIDTDTGNANVWKDGNDAKAIIDGTQTVVRSSNTFALNGITYTLNKAHEAAATGETLIVSQDVQATVDKVKGFVEKYNALLDTLNGKVKEKYDRNYMPLTDAQRKEMSEDDIAAWEKKAKTGLLQNDSILQGITTKLRNAMSDMVEGTGLTLKDLGITSSSYQDYGKLTIDETKLKQTLQSRPDEAARLLNGVSEEVPAYTRTLTSAQKTTRYNQSGVFQRISDIVDDHISTIRDADDKKGILLEKAGITGDLSATSNTIYKELQTYDERISDMLDKLEDKETAYYKKFTALETALQKMNQQSSWIASQMGGG